MQPKPVQPAPLPTPVSSEKGFAALTRVFSSAERDLQRCAALESDSTVDRVLARVGHALSAQRAYVFEIIDTVFIRNTHEWCAPGVIPAMPDLQHVPYTAGAVFWDRFAEYGSIQIEDVSSLLATSELRHLLEEQDIRALIAAPFWRNGQMAGFVGLDYTDAPRKFLAIEDNLLRGLAAQIGMLRALVAAERETLRITSELARAQSRLSAAVAALPELLVETDRDGVIIGFHQSSPLTFAATPQEVIGQMPEAVLPPHLARICRKAMREVTLFGWSQSHGYSVETRLGPKWYTLYATARGPGEHGQAPGFLFVVRDVTHAQLQDRQVRQLVRVAELSSNIIMLTDRTRRVGWMNPTAETRTGYTRKEAEGLRPSEILRLADASPDLVEELCNTLDAGHAIQREIMARNRDGVDYWLELNVQPLHDDTGAVDGYMVIGVDTTTHKLAEARLLHDRDHAMGASNEGIALIRPNGRLSYANRALRTALGMVDDTPLDALLWTDVTPPELADKMTAILPQLHSLGSWEGEFSRLSAQGTMEYFALTMSVQEDTSTLVILRDITRRKQAEQEQARLREQLQKAQSRQLGAQLAAGMAHDFANVLATISGSVDLLTQQAGPDALPTIQRIRAATEEAHGLARGLTRLDAARPKATTLALAPILRQAITLLRPGLDAPMRLDVTLPEDALTVHGDRIELMQLVLNLLLNARDACRDSLARSGDGPISLELTASLCPESALPAKPDLGAIVPGTEYVRIEISDCGDGLAPDLRDSVFNPYVTTKGDSGAGLGLAVVADIVKTRGAAPTMADKAPKGTRVSVYWPRQSVIVQAAVADNWPLSQTSILLVDNDDLLLQELSDLLAQAGAEVASCIDPADALEAVTQAPLDWDLVLTDYNMDSMTGLDLAKKMHDQREDLPIVLMTGNSELHFATKSVQTEFAATLRKPISPTVLISVLLAAKLRSQRGI